MNTQKPLFTLHCWPWAFLQCLWALTKTCKQHLSALHTVKPVIHWFLLSFAAVKDSVIDMLVKTLYKVTYKARATLLKYHFSQTSTDRFNLPQHAAMRWEGEDKTTLNMTCMSKTSLMKSVGKNCRWGAEGSRGTSFSLSPPHTSSVVMLTQVGHITICKRTTLKVIKIYTLASDCIFRVKCSI